MRLLAWDHPLLKQKLEPFDVEGKDLKQLEEQLIAKCEEFRGAGLAANQVGVSLRYFVLCLENFKQAYFNPEVIGISPDKELMEEGCLTRPGLWLKVSRPKSITVRYINSDGDTVVESFDGYKARAFLHEYDHMEGKDFTERVSTLKMRLAKKKKDKTRKKLIQHLAKTGQLLLPKNFAPETVPADAKSP